jgi:hypothetical protein
MVIRRLEGNAIEFIAIEPIELNLLRQVPAICESGENPRSQERLFSKPADAPEGVDFFFKSASVN